MRHDAKRHDAWQREVNGKRDPVKLLVAGNGAAPPLLIPNVSHYPNGPQRRMQSKSHPSHDNLTPLPRSGLTLPVPNGHSKNKTNNPKLQNLEPKVAPSKYLMPFYLSMPMHTRRYLLHNNRSPDGFARASYYATPILSRYLKTLSLAKEEFKYHRRLGSLSLYHLTLSFLIPFLLTFYNHQHIQT